MLLDRNGKPLAEGQAVRLTGHIVSSNGAQDGLNCKIRVDAPENEVSPTLELNSRSLELIEAAAPSTQEPAAAGATT